MRPARRDASVFLCFSQTTLTDPTFPNVTGGLAPAPTAPSVTGMPKDYQVAMIKTWSLSVEQQFPGNWLFTLAGAGDIANHLNTSYNLQSAGTDHGRRSLL